MKRGIHTTAHYPSRRINEKESPGRTAGLSGRVSAYFTDGKFNEERREKQGRST